MVYIGENYLNKDFFLTKELTVHDIIYSISYIITKVFDHLISLRVGWAYSHPMFKKGATETK